jgi:hypothetical protein
VTAVQTGRWPHGQRGIRTALLPTLTAGRLRPAPDCVRHGSHSKAKLAVRLRDDQRLQRGARGSSWPSKRDRSQENERLYHAEGAIPIALPHPLLPVRARSPQPPAVQTPPRPVATGNPPPTRRRAEAGAATSLSSLAWRECARQSLENARLSASVRRSSRAPPPVRTEARCGRCRRRLGSRATDQEGDRQRNVVELVPTTLPRRDPPPATRPATGSLLT